MSHETTKEYSESRCSWQVNVEKDKKDKKFSSFLIEYLMFISCTTLSITHVQWSCTICEIWSETITIETKKEQISNAKSYARSCQVIISESAWTWVIFILFWFWNIVFNDCWLKQIEVNSLKERFIARIIFFALISTLWNSDNMTLTRQKYVKNIFDFISTSTLIFVCLCIENEQKEFQTRKWRLIKFQSDLMTHMIYILIEFVLS